MKQYSIVDLILLFSPHTYKAELKGKKEKIVKRQKLQFETKRHEKVHHTHTKAKDKSHINYFSTSTREGKKISDL